MAEAEPLLTPAEARFPAEVQMVRTVAANALISLLPGLVGGQVQVRWRLGAETIHMAAAGAVHSAPFSTTC